MHKSPSERVVEHYGKLTANSDPIGDLCPDRIGFTKYSVYVRFIFSSCL